MAKRVTSKDSRKPAIVAAMKAITGTTKITDLMESADAFTGNCLHRVDKRFPPTPERPHGFNRVVWERKTTISVDKTTLTLIEKASV